MPAMLIVTDSNVVWFVNATCLTALLIGGASIRPWCVYLPIATITLLLFGVA